VWASFGDALDKAREGNVSLPVENRNPTILLTAVLAYINILKYIGLSKIFRTDAIIQMAAPALKIFDRRSG
jgi:hypothetical protein